MLRSQKGNTIDLSIAIGGDLGAARQLPVALANATRSTLPSPTRGARGQSEPAGREVRFDNAKVRDLYCVVFESNNPQTSSPLLTKGMMSFLRGDART